ncbi:hypothetical protein EB1_04630 [Empedobacter brevis NBRC 14943 = ATCC 43319]|uniref:Uncharacterized protein n=1 Tax=Empedobacter brevis NBRC 14943 = ATCC 43319 TaxID=1218108 RepID=A0A511NCY0_9FLAO|nr:hypothetical protein EB1_04630 [Empedobacter brevis NBRC 14943 = ATCC 43319]
MMLKQNRYTKLFICSLCFFILGIFSFGYGYNLDYYKNDNGIYFLLTGIFLLIVGFSVGIFSLVKGFIKIYKK